MISMTNTVSEAKKLDSGKWRYQANQMMDARRRSQFDLGRVDAYI